MQRANHGILNIHYELSVNERIEDVLFKVILDAFA